MSVIEHMLGYLNHELHGRRIISHAEYASMADDVLRLLTTGALPDVIVPLRLKPNGALRSSCSVGFVTYGIYLLYCRNLVARSVWIEYLCVKISRSKSIIEKKFSLKPDTGAEKIEGD